MNRGQTGVGGFNFPFPMGGGGGGTDILYNLYHRVNRYSVDTVIVSLPMYHSNNRQRI